MLPEMTDEQRAAALQRAALARRMRAEIKALLQTGSLTFADVLEKAEADDLVAGTRVKAIVSSMPKMGKITTIRLMEEIGIAENRTLRGLTPRQTKELLDRFS
jgi:putative heme iron utilization protein